MESQEADDTTAVPLDEMPDADVIAVLLDDPSEAQFVSCERAAALLVRLAMVRAALERYPRPSEEPKRAPKAEPANTGLLKAKDAAALLSLPPRSMYRGTLRKMAVRLPGRRGLRWNRAALDRRMRPEP